MKSRLIISSIVAFFALFIGCKKDTFIEKTGVCPKVLSTIPVNLATNVPQTQIISVLFNENMNPESFTPQSFTVMGAPTAARASVAVTGAITYDPILFTLRLVPSSKLTPNTTFTGKVKAGMLDMDGNALQADYVWTFSTGALIAPVVIFTDPVDTATGVPVNKIITATFNVPMDPATLTNSTFTVMDGVNPVAGVISYNANTVTFSPAADLQFGTLYSCEITTGAKDEAGTSLTADYEWSFTTSNVVIIAPTVISTNPADNDTGVLITTVVTATFSEIMDPLTINDFTFLLMEGTNPIAGVVTYSGTVATFTPNADLLDSTVYTATITTGAQNLVGTPLTNDYVWEFTTEQIIVPPAVDLKSAEEFGILAGVGISNNAGFSVINDLNVGISPGVRSSITGFPPAIVVNGSIHASDDLTPVGIAALLTQAKQDLTDAYLFAEGATDPAPVTVSGDQGGLTLAPGIYKSTSTLLIQSGDLTLDGQGDPNSFWIFQVASAFTTVGGAGGSVILTGGAQAKNVFWQTGSSAVIGDNTSFKGNILALTSITMNANAVAEGRMLARNGSVVMTSTNIINKP